MTKDPKTPKKPQPQPARDELEQALIGAGVLPPT